MSFANISRYFIASGSAYEVCISIRQSKDIMWKMALPTADMFDKAEQSALVTLREHFNAYKRSSFFPILIEKAQIKCDDEEAARIKAGGCFASIKEELSTSKHGSAYGGVKKSTRG